MGYCVEDSFVRVDIFKPSGKWYTKLSIQWIGYTGDIHEAFHYSLKHAIGESYKDMTAVCLEPYHEFSHPLMVKI